MPEARTACPSCHASVRPGATFCGQCYADFRPAPAPASAPVTPAPTAAYRPPAADPLTAPLLDVVLPAAPASVPAQSDLPPAAAPTGKPAGWPCSRCEHLNGLAEQVCAVCGAPFLARVAEETKLKLDLPLVGDLGRYGRGQRAAIAFGAIIAVLVPLALVTLLLTKSPPKVNTPAPTPATSSSGSVTTTGPGG